MSEGETASRADRERERVSKGGESGVWSVERVSCLSRLEKSVCLSTEKSQLERYFGSGYVRIGSLKRTVGWEEDSGRVVGRGSKRRHEPWLDVGCNACVGSQPWWLRYG